MTVSTAYWDKVGSDWNLIGTPLRPCPEDTAFMEQIIDRWARTRRIAAPHAVILGVTQEIVTMQWPENTNILAFDREPGMIQSLWPRHRFPNAAALCADWLALPLVDGYADLVVGDGSFTLLAFPGAYRELAQELSRILSPGGIVVIRMYVAPEIRESVDDIFEDLWSGAIGNFNTFKFRLAMSLIDPADFCVSINDVWEAWNAHIRSPEKLAETLGWPLPVIRMIERYRGAVSTRYSFPPLEHVRETLAPLFREEELNIPSYQDGECYPTICFRKI